jgi:enediyne biosynthesis protein E2
MPTSLGSVRRRVLTPQLREVTFAKRGFPATPSAATQRLEAIPQAVICGFEWGIDARDQWEVERRLELVDAEQRGFAYEGVTMAFTVLDAMAAQAVVEEGRPGPDPRSLLPDDELARGRWLRLRPRLL